MLDKNMFLFSLFIHNFPAIETNNEQMVDSRLSVMLICYFCYANMFVLFPDLPRPFTSYSLT